MEYFYNVKFSVLTSQYDDMLSTRVLKPDPILVNIQGHLTDSNTGLERGGSDGAEPGRSPRFRMNVRLTDSQLEKLGTGATILITHKKHKDLRRWVLLTESQQEQYLAQMDTQSGPNSRYVALSLTRKDQS